MDMPAPSLTIAILAGGRSTRMGRDKALLAVGGMTMLERIARVGWEVSRDLLILGRENAPAGWPADIPAEFLPDVSGERQGPMQALINALECRKSEVLLLACDMPLITTETLRLIVAAHRAQPGALATIATQLEDGDVFLEPMLAIYTPGVLPVLRQAAREHEGAFQPLKKANDGIRQWRVPEARLHELLNVNDVLALKDAEQRLKAK